MDLDFTEEHEMLRDMVRGVCAEYALLELVRELENHELGMPETFWKQLVELGLVGILVPEEYGGQGQSLLEAAILYEEFGRALAPSPHFVSAVLSASALAIAGSEAQKQAWLPGIAAGDLVLTPAWLEPWNGFGARGVQVRAEVNGDGFVLDGAKMHVNYAALADRLVVLARTGEAEEAIDLFLVDPKAAGVTLSQRENLGSETTFRVGFAGVQVAASDRIGEPGSGWEMGAVMNDAIVLAAAQAPARKAAPR